ncbi:hypothetical protein Airi02_041530 [Actinoallomurus iriomotensis]|uniref:Uncharacterized protein n=1 Tax=Actinoallomurus iriomotensis TaxID=478107 RepID=A0A9W6S2J1_9ACTN|nr:hypothetical protein Airi02_041530 [Actinoallomurus iriomotensis]
MMHRPAECVHCALRPALESAARLNLTFWAVAFLLETLTVYLTADPAWIAAVPTRVKARLSSAVGVGVGVGVSESVPDGDAEGDVLPVVSAMAAAVPLTRTMPVPTLMISGVRTDRASTAHDLLNDRR